jgi:hypothetical protein
MIDKIKKFFGLAPVDKPCAVDDIPEIQARRRVRDELDDKARQLAEATAALGAMRPIAGLLLKKDDPA